MSARTKPFKAAIGGSRSLAKMTTQERQALARKQKREARQELRREAAALGASFSQPMVLTVPKTMRGGDEHKYVDGYKAVTAIHELATTNDTWADCELNPVNAAGAIGCLPVPKQGDDFADRDGRKILIKKIVIRGIINWPAANTVTAGAGTSPVVRLIIVKNKQTAGVELDAEAVVGPGLGSDGAAAQTGGAAIMSLSKPTGWGKFQIMKDKMYTRPLDAVFQDGTDGRKILIKKIVIRGIINWPAANTVTAGAGTSPVVRLIIVKNKQTAGVELDAEAVVGPGLGSDGAAAQTGGAAIMSLSKPTGWGKFQIMKDKMYTRPLDAVFQDGTDGAENGCTIPFKFTLNLNTEVNFSGTTGVVGSVIDNSFALIGASSDTSVNPTITYIARTTFIG